MTRVRPRAGPDSVAIVRAGCASFAIVVVLASGCGDAGCGDSASATTPDAVGGEASGSHPDAAASADPLLARARASIEGGRIDPAVAAELRASTDPAHARAARLLAAFEGERVVSPTSTTPADDGPAPVGPPPVVPPAEMPPADAPPADETEPAPPPAASSTPVTEPPPQGPPPRAKTSRRELSGLSLQPTDGGATLTIKAPGGVTVGVANQPSSGIVRLVIEGASARPKVVGARPKVAGARVTGVRKGEDTVQITLQLDPGWRLAGVKPFSGGARVKLVAP